jgi:methionyl-tRNA synthetase
LSPAIKEQWKYWNESFERFKIEWALSAPMYLVESCNLMMQTNQVWSLEKEEKLAFITEFLEVIRHASLMLLPFMPETAQKISKQLNVPYADEMLEKSFTLTDERKAWGGIKNWKSVGEPAILFPKVE